MASELVNVVFQFLHHVPMPEAMREALTHAKAAVDQRDFWLSILVFAVVLRLLRRTRVPKIVVKLTDEEENGIDGEFCCLLYTSPSPRDRTRSRMPSSA